MSQNPSKWTVALLVSAGIFIALLDTTIVDIVLPKMMSAMEADIYGIQWVVITYFLGAAIAMTAVGWIADAVGRRNTYIAGILLFVAMSALAGFATSLPIMLFARFFQGIAEGIMMPVSLVILYEAFPPEERGLALGVYGVSASFAPALGPTLGGLLTEYLNWRWVFFINLPVGLLDVALIWWVMTNVRPESRPGRFDIVGFILCSVSLSALIVFLGKGQEHGWLHSDYILGLVVIFLTFGIAAAAWVAFSREPLFPRRIMGCQPFRFGIWAMMFFSVTAYGFFFLLPIYLQRVHGYTTFQSGLILLPGALFAGFSTLLAGGLSDRIGPKWVSVSMLLGVVAASWIFHTDPDTPRSFLYLDYIFWGFFVGGTFAPIMLMSMGTLEERDAANGSTLLNVSRLVAGSIGTSYATSILSARRDAFYDTLAGNLTWGSSGSADLLARISEFGGQAVEVFDPAAWTKAAAMVQELLLLRAWSYAFEASYRHLAVISLVAIVFVLLIRFSRKQSRGIAAH